ncbi:MULTISPECIES: aminotransferase class I/II-fold pyridoxal phosphate-dependent enzyme [Flavobacterium]|uniref:Aminotransferase class I/II-fold pyridoxal phosphate-dependent enzyme n=1 Tax=Flavobacterium jumunjinense TaxID=998845 RepID=A0ABV5GLT9_9FLAO|nr:MULTISPECIES: pyridoxal phosphate-dependent aminotransferase family protein [Flavobacterium]
MKLPQSLQNKLENRSVNNLLRTLPEANNLIDFASNDYLGFSRNETIFQKTNQLLLERKITQNGATGSRLLSGNHELYFDTEEYIASFHQSEDALIFNSGYDANVGFFSAVPQRNDIIVYDELIHASIRDGIQMSLAKAYKFKHNNLESLEKILQKEKTTSNVIYVVTESVFSMDGDSPDIGQLVKLTQQYNALLIVDEAHALGVFGAKGEGLVQSLQLQDEIFARIMTFGKGLGCHGAAILGSKSLKDYLVNFSRSFIYTTALAPHSIATILIAYQELEKSKVLIQKLQNNSLFFNSIHQDSLFKSSIKSIVIPGNNNVKQTALFLKEKGFDVKPIVSPTVPKGEERLRFCLHSYNSNEEIQCILLLLEKHL